MSDVNVLIILGICGMLIMAFSVIMFVMLYQRKVIKHQEELKTINDQKEKELIQASIKSEENERSRIAAELHDDVASTLASARLFLYKGKDVHFDERTINQSKSLLDEGIRKVRNISHNLQPSMLDLLGIQKSLDTLAETLNSSGKMQAQSRVLNDIPRMDDTTELSIYRISQELINNILKHTEATTLLIESGMPGDVVEVTFIHDGFGLTNEMYNDLIFKKGTIGLKNIVNRLKLINGSIDFVKEGNLLYKTTVTVPFKVRGSNI